MRIEERHTSAPTCQAADAKRINFPVRWFERGVRKANTRGNISRGGRGGGGGGGQSLSSRSSNCPNWTEGQEEIWRMPLEGTCSKGKEKRRTGRKSRQKTAAWAETAMELHKTTPGSWIVGFGVGGIKQ